MRFIHDQMKGQIANAVEFVVGLHILRLRRVFAFFDVFDHFSEV